MTTAPLAFTTDRLGWEPWLEPLAEAELTDAHREALIDQARVDSPYFRLLARDPAVLHARTKTDLDIFHNADGGLPRAERELAATATSRHNGCVFCASVHARFAAHYSRRPDDVERLLDEGVGAEQDRVWRAVVDASVALAATPSALTGGHLDALRAAGLDDLAISDVLHAAAFFNWANRLMLSLGEPTAPPAPAGPNGPNGSNGPSGPNGSNGSNSSNKE
ncbi:alkylhydroperoxidase domain protein [Nonomuraea sp. NPDC005501]|uniref:alkylhydroperoxidase domain protein n=1 Tax=Nonomuraea sp. NPDC005501 TaxID=3156884 RepID=UPI0033B1EE0D